MNFKKLGIIIQREYLNKVKKKSFLLITFLAPVLFAGIAILPSLIMLGAKEEAKQVGVIDRSGIVMPFLTDNEVTHFQDLGPDASPEAIKSDLSASGVDILLTISELDTEARTVSADCYSEKPLGMDTGEMIESRINDAVEAYRIDSYGIENLEEIMAGVKSNVKLRSYTIDESGKESISESGIYMALSMILGMALYMFIALFSGMVMSSVIEEKSSRVVEVLMSSVKATELMFGKIIGVALVALTQFLLWILLTLMLIGVAGGILGKDKLMGMLQDDPTTEMVSQMNDNVNLPDGMDVVMSTLGNINLGQILFAFLFFFIFGYLLYASLFAAIGSAVENEGDSSQLQIPVTIPLLLAFFIAIYAFKAPDSSLVFWGSIIPFTSPIVMLARIPFGVATWELVLSMVLLVVTFVVCAWASAKIYKVGILMYGKKSTFKDLWKWLKQK
ncbi:MAG: ABC transporter permease [Bacteroidales bacterium]|nr:ABC transporter permease [Bacteroidales bacterium]MBR1783098.1 ABC transporter permease [Bacteroidales bacterium]